MRRTHPAPSRGRRARVCAAMLAATPGIVNADVSPAPMPPTSMPAAVAGALPGDAPAPLPGAALPPAGASSAPVRAPALRLSVDGTLAATDNAGSTSDAQKKADVLLLVTPRATWHRDAPGLKADVDASLLLLTSAAGHQPSSARPQAVASGTATLLDDWLYLDALASAVQAQIDPFGPRAQDTSSANKRTEESVMASPWLRHHFTRDVSMLVRRQDQITWHTSGADTTHIVHGTLAQLDVDPKPLGGTASFARQESHDRNVALSDLRLDTARAGLAWAPPGTDVEFTAEGGRDHLVTGLTDHTDPLASAGMKWRPSPRTDVEALVEQRFFGRGGALTLRHRTPWTAISLEVSREPVLVSEAFGGQNVLALPSDLRAALDSMLTTRYPDPKERAALVDAILSGRGLDPLTGGAVATVADYPQLVTQVGGSWTYMTPRTTFSVAAWGRTAEVLRRKGDPLAALPGFGSDNHQVGASVQVNRKLTSTVSVDAVAQVARIKGTAATVGQRSDDRSLRLSLVRELSPRTTATIGAQSERFQSTVVGMPSFHSNLVFVALNHRF